VRLVAPWEEAEVLIDDERSMITALEASGDVYGTVTYRAAETVFLALPQEPNEEIFLGHKAIERELLVIENLDGGPQSLGYRSKSCWRNLILTWTVLTSTAVGRARGGSGPGFGGV
jgi:hypothetical protein